MPILIFANDTHIEVEIIFKHKKMTSLSKENNVILIFIAQLIVFFIQKNKILD